MLCIGAQMRLSEATPLPRHAEREAAEAQSGAHLAQPAPCRTSTVRALIRPRRRPTKSAHQGGGSREGEARPCARRRGRAGGGTHAPGSAMPTSPAAPPPARPMGPAGATCPRTCFASGRQGGAGAEALQATSPLLQAPGAGSSGQAGAGARQLQAAPRPDRHRPLRAPAYTSSTLRSAMILFGHWSPRPRGCQGAAQPFERLRVSRRSWLLANVRWWAWGSSRPLGLHVRSPLPAWTKCARSRSPQT